jgi:hypothetical protein
MDGRTYEEDDDDDDDDDDATTSPSEWCQAQNWPWKKAED